MSIKKHRDSTQESFDPVLLKYTLTQISKGIQFSCTAVLINSIIAAAMLRPISSNSASKSFFKLSSLRMVTLIVAPNSTFIFVHCRYNVLFWHTLRPANMRGALTFSYFFVTVIIMDAFLPLAVLTVIFALPGLMALTTPLLVTIATFLLLLVQVKAVFAFVGVNEAFN